MEKAQKTSTGRALDVAVKVSVEDHQLLRRIAEAEQRNYRMVVSRALRKYAPKLAAEMQKPEAA